jgi:hypothetical protein
MSPRHLKIRELTAWGFDHPVDRGLRAEEQLRNAAFRAQRRMAARSPYPADSPLSVEETEELASVLAARKDTVASSGEFDGLTWELSIVDLRKLIAFQRRIRFDLPDSRRIHRGARSQQLLDLALPLHARSSSPYMEVASYRGRWFLRDGYHRSFRLLKQGVWLVPCVVVYAETLAQMGAVGSRFFSQEVLFSEHPPMVTDFLEEEVTVGYCRAVPAQPMAFIRSQSQESLVYGVRQQEVR